MDFDVTPVELTPQKTRHDGRVNSVNKHPDKRKNGLFEPHLEDSFLTFRLRHVELHDQCFERQITPTIIFENLTAAVRLGEQMLNASATVEDFNEAMKNSRCSPANNVNEIWREQEFGKAKDQIATGDGLGRRFLLHFLGERKSMAPATVQTVLDTYYAESRKAAQEKKRKEQERIAAEKASIHHRCPS